MRCQGLTVGGDVPVGAYQRFGETYFFHLQNWSHIDVRLLCCDDAWTFIFRGTVKAAGRWGCKWLKVTRPVAWCAVNTPASAVVLASQSDSAASQRPFAREGSIARPRVYRTSRHAAGPGHRSQFVLHWKQCILLVVMCTDSDSSCWKHAGSVIPRLTKSQLLKELSLSRYRKWNGTCNS